MPALPANRQAGRTRTLCLSIAAGLLFSASAAAQNIDGAIYTGLVDGLTVNGNQYDDKLAVYLNGGPQNCNASGLPVGEYYFMVTNPEGSVLLSMDDVWDRKFAVHPGNFGRISENLGNIATHPNGASACAGISIRLGVDPGDYADTDNQGGVYKVWITRAPDFEAYCGAGNDCGLDGFIHSNTKTDNFKVDDGSPPPPPPPEEELLGQLEAFKFYDANVDGVYDAGIDTPLANWPMTLVPALGPSPAEQVTGGSGTVLWVELPDDTYTVTEGEPVETNWYNTLPSGGTWLDGDTVLTPVSGSATVVAQETARVEFGNFCQSPSGGHTLGFWSNKNGNKTMADDGGVASELALLSSYTLRNADGTNFNPTSYTQFRTWLLNGNATNMSYMLSVQMAAMILNIEEGLVDGNALYLPADKTIDELVALAEQALAADADGLALDGAPNRAYQGQLKDWIDQLNNDANVVPTLPCGYSFAPPPAPVVEPIIAP
jgi:hypothetical protein